MKGILKKTDKGWIVYFSCDRHYEQLPVHPADVDNQQLKEGETVEFDDVPIFHKTGQCMAGEVEGHNVWYAKITIPKKEPESSWDEIFDLNLPYSLLIKYLKKHYHPPLKL